MNFFKRAITSITRRLGKTIILLILVFILGNVISGAISIRQAVTNTEVNMRKKIGAAATIEIDYEAIQSLPGFSYEDFDWNTVEPIKPEEIEKIGALPYVKYYNYSLHTGLQSTDLKQYVEPNSKLLEDGTIVRPDGSEEQQIIEAYFTLKGGQNPEPVAMKENKMKLVEGRLLNEGEIKNAAESKVLITKNLANTNNLTVGSKFKLEKRLYTGETTFIMENDRQTMLEPDKTIEFEFEVVGIYENLVERKINNQDDQQINIYYYENEMIERAMYTSNAVIRNINDIEKAEESKLNPEPKEFYASNLAELSTTYALNDPADLEKFKEEASSMLLKYHKLVDNSNVLDNIAGPMRNMDWIASIVLYVAIGATLLILSLLITLFLRDRKHEIGIYLSLGEKKDRVILQIVAEVVLISALAITLSLFTGNLIAGVVSDNMLNNQLIAEQENGNNNQGYNGNFGILYGGDLTVEDLVESYKVSIDLKTVLMFYLIGISSVMVSTLIPIIYVVRLNPKRIMM